MNVGMLSPGRVSPETEPQHSTVTRSSDITPHQYITYRRHGYIFSPGMCNLVQCFVDERYLLVTGVSLQEILGSSDNKLLDAVLNIYYMTIDKIEHNI